METIRKYYRVDRKEICFLKWILEACDGIAMLTTVDSEKGIVSVYVSPGCEAEVASVLTGVQKSVMIEPLRETSVSQKHASAFTAVVETGCGAAGFKQPTTRSTGIEPKPDQ